MDVFDGGLSLQGEEEVCAGGLRVRLRVPEPQVRERHGAGEDSPHVKVPSADAHCRGSVRRPRESLVAW